MLEAEKRLQEAKAYFDAVGDILHTLLLGFIYIVFGGMVVGFTICVVYRIYTNQFWPWLKNGLNDPPSYYVSNNK